MPFTINKHGVHHVTKKVWGQCTIVNVGGQIEARKRQIQVRENPHSLNQHACLILVF